MMLAILVLLLLAGCATKEPPKFSTTCWQRQLIQVEEKYLTYWVATPCFITLDPPPKD